MISHDETLSGAGHMRGTTILCGPVFISTYRRRRNVAYLPPPRWVATTPVHQLASEVAVYAVDEMGKQDVCPIVLSDDLDARKIPGVLAPVLAQRFPARLELRLTANDAELRSFLIAHEFTVDRVQAGMAIDVDASYPAAREPSLLEREEASDGELAEFYNACFGLRMSSADVHRMRGQASWDERNLFVVRRHGTIVASLRVLFDETADGIRYGFLRGMGVHPEHRRSSMPLLAGMYQAALARLADFGAARCHMLVDRATEHTGKVMRRLYSSLGFAEETLIYRMRQREMMPGS